MLQYTLRLPLFMASQPPTIDPIAAGRWHKLPHGPSAWLHEEIASRMADRLQWIKLQPQAVAHWEPVLGGLKAHSLLTRQYPQARQFWLGSNPEPLKAAKESLQGPWWKPGRWTAQPAVLEKPPGQLVQMVWANMALHMAVHPQELIQIWHDQLAVGGFLMFSCLGPDTLASLRALYAKLGWPPPAHEFTDMHDWGDMLVASGFAEPVMDMERITLTYATPTSLLADLRGLGRNLHHQRFGALRARHWHQQLTDALKHNLADPADSGRIPLSFEVIYGHALKPAKRLAVRPEIALSLDDMRQVLRSGKARP